MSQQKPESQTVVDRGGHPIRTLPKVSSGIPGLDEITHGGLPRERTTLICGAAGAGKSLFSMQFLVRGIVNHDEPGALISFEESEEDIALNVASLGFNLQELIDQGKLAMDYVRVEHSEVTETGAFSLDGLFLRIESAIETVGAKRVVIDTLESLFGGLTDYITLRSELRRLFRWLKDRGITAIVTAERGDGTLTQNRLEEYVSDCVILLDHRVANEISTRRLRVVKYRGSTHGTNEYPFLIDENGIIVMPITSAALKHTVSNERISTGIQRLDSMLGGQGYYRGSTILASGTAGAGKSSIAAHFADSVCRGGERCIIFAFEESADQIKRNMASIGLDLARHEAEGLLHIAAARPTMHGLESHLASMHKLVRDFEPSAVIIDPVSSLLTDDDVENSKLMAIRLVDYLKTCGITALMTSLTRNTVRQETTEISISSIIDTWLLVRNVETNGERNRLLYVLKSRGMSHSNQVREFLITGKGVDLVDVYTGPDGLLTGSARAQQEQRERRAQDLRAQEVARGQRELERKRRAIEHDIAMLQEELEEQGQEMEFLASEDQATEDFYQLEHSAMSRRRGAD